MTDIINSLDGLEYNLQNNLNNIKVIKELLNSNVVNNDEQATLSLVAKTIIADYERIISIYRSTISILVPIPAEQESIEPKQEIVPEKKQEQEPTKKEIEIEKPIIPEEPKEQEYTDDKEDMEEFIDTDYTAEPTSGISEDLRQKIKEL